MSGHFTFRKQKITFLDGAGSPMSLDTTGYDVGDFSMGNLQQSGKDTFDVYARGVFVGTEFGNDSVLQGSMTVNAKAEYLNNSGAGRVPDFVLKLGAASGGTTTNPGDTDVWLIDIQRDFYNDVGLSSKLSTIVYHKVRVTLTEADGQPNTYKLDLSCKGGTTITNED